jgi:site-specific DNA recombinase
VDDGYSGTMLERPGLDALRDFVAAGGVETVLCLCPDRLSRNLLHLGLLVEDFQKRGAKVAFVNQQVDDTPEGKLLLQIQGAVSEYERTKILDRTRRGKRHKVEQGQLAGPIAAYGYTYIHVSRGAPSRWDINPAEAEVVRQIFAWFVEERLSIRQIARELAARAIATRKGRAQWCTSQIHRILANEAYLGTAYYFKTYPTLPDRPREEKAYRRKPKTTNRRRDREEWVPVAVPAIIDRETYDRAQAFLQENLRFANRNNTRHQYLLRGLLRCGKCGRSYIGNGSGARTYYVCSGNNALAAGRPDRCGASSLRTDRIEPLVWDTIRSLLDDPGLLRQYAEQQAPATHSSEDAAARGKAFERQIAQADAEEMRVVRLYREGIISEELLQAQLAEVRAKRQAIQQDLNALNREAEEAAAFETQEAAIQAFCEDIRLGQIGRAHV